MLKQRLITAAILIPLVIWSIFGLPTLGLALLLALVVLAGAWEWGRLIQLQTVSARLVYVGVIALLMLALAFGIHRENVWIVAILFVAGLWWLVAIAWVARYRGQQRSAPENVLMGALIGGGGAGSRLGGVESGAWSYEPRADVYTVFYDFDLGGR